jgi:hypothetical protein
MVKSTSPGLSHHRCQQEDVDYLKLKAFRFCSDRANSQYLGRVLEISEVLTNTKFRSRFKNATESLFAC